MAALVLLIVAMDVFFFHSMRNEFSPTEIFSVQTSEEADSENSIPLVPSQVNYLLGDPSVNDSALVNSVSYRLLLEMSRTGRKTQNTTLRIDLKCLDFNCHKIVRILFPETRKNHSAILFYLSNPLHILFQILRD